MQVREETSLGRADLGRRLRELRSVRPGVHITQRSLADALDVSHTLVSSWESATDPAVPPDLRLRQLATLFATQRSSDGGGLSLLDENALTAQEKVARDELYEELIGLRDAAATPEEEPARVARPAPGRSSRASAPVPASSWHFPDGGPVRIVCGRVPEESRGAYSDPANPNFTRLHGFADPDALIELFGHIRMVNPESDVRFLLGDDLLPDDLTAHVVLLGGLRLNDAARFFARASGLPVRQVSDDNIENGEVFEIEREAGRRRFLPTFLEGDPALGLIEDVGLVARMPNPNYLSRTLTLCNGVFSRGVLGAVRALTDAQLRNSNEEYIRSRFASGSEFGLLLRVPVFRGETSTPDLSNEYHRLYAWTGRDSE